MWARVMVARVHPALRSLDTQINPQYIVCMLLTGFLFTLGVVAALVCLAHWRMVLTVLAYVTIVVLIIVGFATAQR